jgi:DNA transformation protein
MDDSLVEFVLDQLHELGAVRRRAMFGGFGLYCGDAFFGIVYDGRLYFKTDEISASQYVARGMNPFRPNDRQTLRNYYEVPPEIVDDREQLTAWAGQALGLLA